MNNFNRSRFAPSRKGNIPGVLGMKELCQLVGDGLRKACTCGSDKPELRYCKANNAAGWQCAECNSVLSHWIPHERLPGINVLSLPKWQYDRKIPGQQPLL
jgi:hypothetical protein